MADNSQLEIVKDPVVGYRLKAKQFLPYTREQIFGFYGDARQLESITPPWLKFQIVTPLPIVMKQGTLIDYKIRLHGLPLRWRTEIALWEPPYRFVDQQLRGPFRRWYHTHTFIEQPGGTLVDDDVHYVVPLGSIVHELFVKRDVRRIFEFRYEALARQFPSR